MQADALASAPMDHYGDINKDTRELHASSLMEHSRDAKIRLGAILRPKIPLLVSPMENSWDTLPDTAKLTGPREERREALIPPGGLYLLYCLRLHPPVHPPLQNTARQH